jgi:hypothetical protein
VRLTFKLVVPWWWTCRFYDLHRSSDADRDSAASNSVGVWRCYALQALTLPMQSWGLVVRCRRSFEVFVGGRAVRAELCWVLILGLDARVKLAKGPDGSGELHLCMQHQQRHVCMHFIVQGARKRRAATRRHHLLRNLHQYPRAQTLQL